MNENNLLIDPELLFQKAQLQPGFHVADLGTDRSGHLIFPASLIVGEKGIVYAVDILKPVLESIKKRAQMESLLNIHTVWSDIEKGKTAIPEKSLDVVFIVNTLSFSQKPEGIIAEAKRLVREKARIVIVDWKEKINTAFGPKNEKLLNFQEVKNWAKTQGLLFQEEFSVGKYHHGLVFFWHE